MSGVEAESGRVASEEELNVDLRGVAWSSVTRATVLVLVAGLLALPLVSGSAFVGFVSLLVLVFAVMASGYNLMLGWPNLFVFCPAALAIIGGVTFALLMQAFGVPYLLAILFAGAVAALVGLVIAFSAVLIGSAFEIIIATLAFEQVVFYVLTNWGEVGSTGISGVPSPSAGVLPVSPLVEQYLFLVLVLTVVTALVAVFDNSLTGSLAIATSENEDLLRSIGYNPARYKLIAVSLGAFVLGVGGSLFASVNGLITPADFTLHQTVFLLVITVIGGRRTIHGPIVGALVMVGLPEVIRSFGFGDYRAYFVGATLIVVVLLLPGGILGGLSGRFGIDDRLPDLRGLWGSDR
ncbi:branched-chain amino acid ABC transporter permease [Halomarina halobia]|uniref:Branched-chain amino acid ABC transporter permease n=1 Tax=Halomarina halobia TaxID=3033386 RepID=A0ABD6AFH6_9EURY|nr:branched-chain amino acid ABC transporter permease [Halomarina sp. PSR21]